MQAIMGTHRTPFYLLFALAVSIVLSACGGGGSSSDSGGAVPGPVLATIQGSVPGTVFMAVNNDTNLEVKRVTANATTKAFSMDIPTGAKYRFYVMENENTGTSRSTPCSWGRATCSSWTTPPPARLSLSAWSIRIWPREMQPPQTPPVDDGPGCKPRGSFIVDGECLFHG